MLESLNDFFTTTYTHNKAFFGIQSVAAMSLIGIGMGLLTRVLGKGWQGVRSRLQARNHKEG